MEGDSMGHPRRAFALSTVAVLALVTILSPTAAVAVETCFADPPPAKTATTTDWGFKMTVSYSYVSCRVTATLENRNPGPTYQDPMHFAIYANPGPCGDDRGTRLKEWYGMMGGYGEPGWKKTLSAYASANQCLTGIWMWGWGPGMELPMYAPIP
jgi:hypothetical protein